MSVQDAHLQSAFCLHNTTVWQGAACHRHPKFITFSLTVCRYDKFDADHFIEFLKEIKRRFTRALVIMDRAPQHKACAVKKARRKMGGIRIAFLPRATPELSAAEECWRQSKGELLRASHATVGNLRDAIIDYFENKTFNLDVYRYLMRSL